MTARWRVTLNQEFSNRLPELDRTRLRRYTSLYRVGNACLASKKRKNIGKMSQEACKIIARPSHRSLFFRTRQLSSRLRTLLPNRGPEKPWQILDR